MEQGYVQSQQIQPRPAPTEYFQGALLGLVLAPTALIFDGVPAAAIESINQWVDTSIQSVQMFLSGQHQAKAAQRETAANVYLLASLPALLRYANDWQRRWNYLRSAGWLCIDNSAKDPDWATAQILCLGDFLEIILSKHLPNNAWAGKRHPDAWGSLTHLKWRIEQYSAAGLCDQQCQRYQWILGKLTMGLADNGQWQLSQASASEPTDEPTDALNATGLKDSASFVTAVLSAVVHPESYSLAVRMASQGGGHSLIAGIVSGALGGRASLPVLWQLNSIDKVSVTVATADALCDQWAGIQPLTNQFCERTT
ncbi:MAG: hypothetical protein WA885_09865 [Phormidesmis sp.]